MMHFKYDDLMILLSTCVDCSRNTSKKKRNWKKMLVKIPNSSWAHFFVMHINYYTMMCDMRKIT